MGFGSAALNQAKLERLKAEEELAKLFPEARVLRMDQDSTAAKDAHEKLLAKFASEKGEGGLVVWEIQRGWL